MFNEIHYGAVIDCGVSTLCGQVGMIAVDMDSVSCEECIMRMSEMANAHNGHRPEYSMQVHEIEE